MRWRMWLPKEDGHRCAASGTADAYGHAISECFEDEHGLFWAWNGEYATSVNYCPECGLGAKVRTTDPQLDEQNEPLNT